MDRPVTQQIWDDWGMVVNPDTVKAQIEEGIIFGISAALFGEITIKNGRVEQTNFGDYRPLRMNGAPVIEVYVSRRIRGTNSVR